MEQVILVDELDNAIGFMEKMEAHRKGELHRAFSICIFNPKGELLMQQRAAEKYHSPGLWTNTCCSHPRPGETVLEAGSRRLQEEMGFTTELQPIFSFIYRAEFPNGLYEHELDHVLMGSYDGPVLLNSAEAAAYNYWSLDAIAEKLAADPTHFTAWFHLLFPRLQGWQKMH
ncbi:MAG TPA: isopentenyl-diphosphate Delta-isomerase [Sediminibacterium sp.]|nr:isopentenyl-diphosphate Delta-isomerase [Sediminibacterium sp.]